MKRRSPRRKTRLLVLLAVLAVVGGLPAASPADPLCVQLPPGTHDPGLPKCLDTSRLDVLPPPQLPDTPWCLGNLTNPACFLPPEPPCPPTDPRCHPCPSNLVAATGVCVVTAGPCLDAVFSWSNDFDRDGLLDIVEARLSNLGLNYLFCKSNSDHGPLNPLDTVSDAYDMVPVGDRGAGAIQLDLTLLGYRQGSLIGAPAMDDVFACAFWCEGDPWLIGRVGTGFIQPSPGQVEEVGFPNFTYANHTHDQQSWSGSGLGAQAFDTQRLSQDIRAWARPWNISSKFLGLWPGDVPTIGASLLVLDHEGPNPCISEVYQSGKGSVDTCRTGFTTDVAIQGNRTINFVYPLLDVPGSVADAWTPSGTFEHTIRSDGNLIELRMRARVTDGNGVPLKWCPVAVALSSLRAPSGGWLSTPLTRAYCGF